MAAAKLTWEEDPIGANLDELADLGAVYQKQIAAGNNPTATRCAMLRLIGSTYILFTGPKPMPKPADA